MIDSRVRDIVIRLELSRASRGLSTSASDRPRTYDVAIYSANPIPGVGASQTRSLGSPSTVAGLPFVGSEWIEIPWALYQEYLGMFVEGEKGRHYMSDRLF